MEEVIDLLQFPYSHYNEKARWALDFKGVPHRRLSYLPGPHLRVIPRLTGQSATPVLRLGGQVIWGSARILDALEQRYPEPSLYPRDPQLRARALEIQTWFDDEIGPRLRTALFAAMLEDRRYVPDLFSAARRPATRALYRAVFPLTRRVMRRSMDITDATVARGDALTRAAFDFVAGTAGPSGHLVGDTFSVADLTAASILAPAADPPGSAMEMPRPLPPRFAAWLRQWQDHPGRAWVCARYRGERPPAAAVAELHPL